MNNEKEILEMVADLAQFKNECAEKFENIRNECAEKFPKLTIVVGYNEEGRQLELRGKTFEIKEDIKDFAINNKLKPFYFMGVWVLKDTMDFYI